MVFGWTCFCRCLSLHSSSGPTKSTKPFASARFVSFTSILFMIILFQVHLQTQQVVEKRLTAMAVSVVRTQGILALYNGLSAALARQVLGEFSLFVFFLLSTISSLMECLSFCFKTKHPIVFVCLFVGVVKAFYFLLLKFQILFVSFTVHSCTVNIFNQSVWSI